MQERNMQTTNTGINCINHTLCPTMGAWVCKSDEI